MDALAVWIGVLAASGIPLFIVTRVIGRLDRRNTEQHASNMVAIEGSRLVLQEIRSDIADVKEDTSEVKSRLVAHLEYHLDHDFVEK